MRSDRDTPGDPVVKKSPYQCREHRPDPLCTTITEHFNSRAPGTTIAPTHVTTIEALMPQGPSHNKEAAQWEAHATTRE